MCNCESFIKGVVADRIDFKNNFPPLLMWPLDPSSAPKTFTFFFKVDLPPSLVSNFYSLAEADSLDRFWWNFYQTDANHHKKGAMASHFSISTSGRFSIFDCKFTWRYFCQNSKLSFQNYWFSQFRFSSDWSEFSHVVRYIRHVLIILISLLDPSLVVTVNFLLQAILVNEFVAEITQDFELFESSFESK